MLYILFQVGPNRYAVQASRIVEVLPLLELRSWPGAKPPLVGLLDYLGETVPVADLTSLLTGKPATRLLSTRILVSQYQDQNGCQHLVGLIAEGATEMLRKNPEDWLLPDPALVAPPFQGPVLVDGGGSVQLVTHQELLPEDLRQTLFVRSLSHAIS